MRVKVFHQLLLNPCRSVRTVEDVEGRGKRGYIHVRAKEIPSRAHQAKCLHTEDKCKIFFLLKFNGSTYVLVIIRLLGTAKSIKTTSVPHLPDRLKVQFSVGRYDIGPSHVWTPIGASNEYIMI